ncbi:MAG: alpha/beta hydrolase [Alphaproteobacteria bacterium]|jgi:pimeloyl-ACP methyl ester carboxylesterase|nr:alpha/beta hydrolase [Alphaproteobacteria bacterium]
MHRVVTLLLLVLLVAGCGPRAEEARRLLADIAAGAQGWSTLRGMAPEPDRRAITYTVEGRARQGDLYLPGAGPRARIVVVPGLSPHGRNDPRLVAFARSLARVRFAVLVPEVPGLRQLRASPEDAVVIADAVSHLAGRAIPDSPSGAAGLAAVSYAVGPALIAAMEPRTADDVAFVLSIGGYYDMTAVITYITTGHYRPRPDADWVRGEPNRLSKWLFLEANAPRLADPADRTALLAMARRRIADRDAAIDDLAAGLGPEGRSVHALLVNDNPDRVPDLISALPASLRDEFATLSPSSHNWQRLQAQLYLVHGRNDPMIPASESRRLANSARPGQAEIYVADGLSHVEFEDGADLFDIFTLIRAGEAILFERDRLAGSS